MSTPTASNTRSLPVASGSVLPLEHRDVPQPAVSPWRSAASAVIGALAGGALALGVAAALGTFHHHDAPHVQRTITTAGVVFVLLKTLAAVAGVWLAVVLVHELAHGLVGRLGGLRLVRITVGPLRLTHGSGGWRAGLTRGSQRFTGSVAVVPCAWTGSVEMGRAWGRMVFAGPGVNLLCAAVLVGIIPMRRGAQASAATTDLLALAALTSLVVGLLSLIPSKSWAGGVSDGEQLRRLRHRDSHAQHPGETFSALVMLGTSAHALRPREWNGDAIAIARRGSSDVPTAAAAHQLLYHHALDCGDVAAARTHLQNVLDLAATTPPPRGLVRSSYAKLQVRGRADLAVAAATFEAAWCGDAAAARAWLARATTHSRGALGTHALEVAHAAIAAADGDLGTRDPALSRAAAVLATGEFAAAALLSAATLEQIAAR